MAVGLVLPSIQFLTMYKLHFSRKHDTNFSKSNRIHEINGAHMHMGKDSARPTLELFWISNYVASRSRMERTGWSGWTKQHGESG